MLLPAALASLAAAGCGGADDEAGSSMRADAGQYPIVVEHSLGPTTIERRPERVVTLGVSDADIALALGVVPVGIHSHYGFDRGVGPWAEDELDELGGEREPAVWKGPQLNFEAIAATRPDLILYVTEGGEEQGYETLSGIAPTVGLPEGAVPYGPSWRPATRLIAEALGLPAEGERLVRQTEDYLAGLRSSNPSFAGKTVTYLDVFGSDVYFEGRRSTVIDLMLELGFRTVPAIGTRIPTRPST